MKSKHQTDLQLKLEKMLLLSKHYRFENIASKIEGLRQRVLYNKVHIVVLGEFNRGKTTLVNALIGEDLLPMDIIPTTAAIWTIEQGPKLQASIVASDYSETPLEATKHSLARLNADQQQSFEQIRFVRMTVPELAIGKDVVIVDTPGVNDINEQRAEITYRFLEAADAALFLMDASSPVTKSESIFLQGQVLDSSLDKILFVLNKSSRLDEDEIEEAIEAAKERLQQLLGRDLPTIAIDAERILYARKKGAIEAAHENGWQILQQQLQRMLDHIKDQATIEKQFEHKTKTLAAQLLQRLSSLLQIEKMNAQQLAKQEEQFYEQLQDAKRSFQRLLHYIEEQGEEQMKRMVRQSLRHTSEDFVESLHVRIGSLQGGIKHFSQKILPYEIQLFVKRWFEARLPEFERYLLEFSQHVVREYRRHFDRVFALQISTLQNLGAMHSSASSNAPNVEIAEATSDYILMGLPAAGLMGASFLGLGPFAPIGLIGGLMYSKYLKSKEEDALREQLLSQLPNLLEMVSNNTLQSLYQSIERWFRDFSASLTRQFEEHTLERQQAFEQTKASGQPSHQPSLGNIQEAIQKLVSLFPS